MVIITDVATAEEHKMLKKAGVKKSNLKTTLPVENLNIFPNPNMGLFNIEFDLRQKGKTAVSIYDLEGKEVFSENLGKFSGKYREEVDLTEHSKGVYLLQIRQGDEQFVKKLMVQ